MPYKTILVPVDPPPAPVNHVLCAAEIARQFDAQLLGLAAEPSLSTDPTGLSEWDVKAAFENSRRARFSHSEQEFTRRAGARPTLWRTSVSDPTGAILTHGRRADLVVLPAQNPLPGIPLDQGKILSSIGAPVLLIEPHTEEIRARYVVIAWKDTKEARRAVQDSMPFLFAAKEVLICSVSEDNEAAEREALSDVKDRLKAHGIKAYSEHVHAAEHPSLTLLHVARQSAAGLVVAGAFGRTRLSEFVFGGFTRDLLSQTQVSVLFSH